MIATTLITARKVIRSEGVVWRYWWTHSEDTGNGEKETTAYTFLRDVLGATGPQAAAVIVAAQADAAMFDGEVV